MVIFFLRLHETGGIFKCLLLCLPISIWSSSFLKSKMWTSSRTSECCLPAVISLKLSLSVRRCVFSQCLGFFSLGSGEIECAPVSWLYKELWNPWNWVVWSTALKVTESHLGEGRAQGLSRSNFSQECTAHRKVTDSKFWLPMMWKRGLSLPRPFLCLMSSTGLCKQLFSSACFVCGLFPLNDTERIASIRFCHSIFVTSLLSINRRQQGRWHPGRPPASCSLVPWSRRAAEGNSHLALASPLVTWRLSVPTQTQGLTWRGSRGPQLQVSWTHENQPPSCKCQLCCVSGHRNMEAAFASPASWPTCDSWGCLQKLLSVLKPKPRACVPTTERHPHRYFSITQNRLR